MAWMKQFILGVRRIRSEMDIPPGKKLPVLLQNVSETDQSRLDNHQTALLSLAKLNNTVVLADSDDAPESALALVGEMKVLIPLAGLIDKDAELQRLHKEIEKLLKEREKMQVKLDNPKFVERAPAELVEKDRQRVAEIDKSVEKLRLQEEKIQRL